MAKITVLEQKTFQGKPSGFKVTLDNGTTGNLTEKESDEGLKVGDEVTCTLIPYTSKKGVQSNLLGLRKMQPSAAQTPPPPPPLRPAINVGVGKSKEELKVEATISVAEVLIKGFCEGKLESAQVSINVKEFGRLLWSEIEEIYGGK
jgi:hypothetical protein